MNRIQRREFLRVPATFDVKILISELENRENEILITTRNISGGGLRLSGINQPLQIGTNLNGVLWFEKDQNMNMEIEFEGTIVNAVPTFQKEELIEYGVKFIKISRLHQEMIIRYCLKRQIEINNTLAIK
ncbi:flagellar brake protein [Aneurinibacillus sp. Ricciae_BoGa-3]|uniref:flagellar brake protein n=1 Tax=Aneurinibacillus sp. Ricciae_BoGa-3 TaxID=3022697 RepID=UPI003FA49B83